MAHSEELYKDILSGIAHNIEVDCEIETNQYSLFNYVQSAFHVSDSRHDELLEAVTQKGLSAKCLKVYVNEAKELKPKCSDTLCNPFVVLYVQSTPSHQFSTSVQLNTLSPVWEENVSIPLKNVLKEDEFVVEVWNSKQTNTINKKKTKKLDHQKSILSKLMKDINISASDVNELIGRCSVSLEAIPTLNPNNWLTLYRNEKVKSRGQIKLQLTIDERPKNSRMMIKEHKCLVQVLLRHELNISKVDVHCWSGEFSSQATAILQQHILLNAISSNECILAQWSAFTKVHVDHALSLGIFKNLLDSLLYRVNSTGINVDETNMFWDGVKELLPSCFSVIRNFRTKRTEGNDHTLIDCLSILSSIANITPPNDFDLFPKVIYGWLFKSNEDLKRINIYAAVKDAIRSRARDFLFQISEFRNVHRENDMDNLQNVIKVIKTIEMDLEHGLKYYNHLFLEKVQCDFTAISFIYYENELSESINLTIQQACKRIEAFDEHLKPGEPDIGTVLFSVYSMLKRFSDLGSQSYAEGNTFGVSSYYEWFIDGVANELDVTYQKSLQRIEKAIELDKLVPVDAAVNYSSSAIDAVAIFHPIKFFWLQLDWPDIESGYTFLAKIVNDICRCCICYADKMSSRVEDLGNIPDVCDGNKFVVTQKWCLAINNIDYMRQSLPPFIKELKVDEIIDKLAEYRSQAEAQRCGETLKTLIDNALDTKENHIFDLLQMIAKHICSTIYTFLLRAMDDSKPNSRFVDELRSYVEDLVQILKTNLNEENFERISSNILDETTNMFYELIQPNTNKKRSPQSLTNLYECLHSLGKCLNFEEKYEILAEIEDFLQLHSLETSHLIHLYYTRRYEVQQTMNDAPHGKLTISGCFNEYKYLELKIFNARDLVSNTGSRHCNPYVQVQLIPNAAIKYDATIKYRTKVKNKTPFPLFDETFMIPISKQHKANGNALIRFIVKNYDLFGMSSRYLGECFITFDEITNSNQNEQIHLTLSHPPIVDCEYSKALKSRDNDKLAIEFTKQIKRRSLIPLPVKTKFRWGSTL